MQSATADNSSGRDTPGIAGKTFPHGTALSASWADTISCGNGKLLSSRLRRATAEEAEAEIRAALEVLGVQDLVTLRTLRIDHETMAEAVQAATAEERFAPIVGDAENNGYPVREDWSEADDAYCFCFTVAPGGVPMYYRTSATEDGGYYSGTEIIAWYTCDGIIFLDVSYPWQVGEAAEAPAETISYAQAQEIAQAEIKGTQEIAQSEFEVTLESLTLEYCYAEENGEYLLTPVWTAAFSFTPDGLDSPVYRFLSLDAFTGEVLFFMS